MSGLRAKTVKIGSLSVVYATGGIVPMLISMLLLPIFTRYLVPAQMGIVSLANQLIPPLAILVQLGLLSSLMSHYFRTEELQRPALVRTVLLGQLSYTAFLCIVMSVAGMWVAPFVLPNLPLSAEKLTGLWLIIVWTCFFTALVRLAVGLSQLHEHAFAAVSINFLQFLLGAVLGVVMVVGFGWQGFGRQAMLFAGVTVAGVVSLPVIWRYSSGGFDWTLFKRVLVTGLTFVPHAVSGMLALTLNAWLLNRLVDAAALGVYGIAIKFAQLMEVALYSLGNAAYPTLARLMADGGEDARRQLSRLYTLFLTGTMWVVLAVSVFSPMAVHLLTAPAYHGAKGIVPWLALAWVVQGFYWVSANRVFYFGKGLWLAVATGSSMVVAVVLSVLLIPRYGLHGAAWALVGCFVARFLVVFRVGRRLLPVPWQYWAILRVLGCTVLLGATDVLLSSRLSPWTMLPVKVLLLLLLIPLAWASGVVNRRELAVGWEILKNKVHAFVSRNGDGA